MARRVRFLVVLTAAVLAAATTSAQARPERPRDQRSAAIGRALGHLRANAAAGEGYRVRDVLLDADGGEHVRLDRYHHGLEVLGGDVVVHGRRDGSFRGRSGGLAGAVRVSRDARVTPRAAAATAARLLPGAASRSTPRLVVSALGAVPALAWETVVEGTSPAGDPSELHVLVSATDGRVLDSWDGIKTVDGTGHSLYGGTVTVQAVQNATGFELRDATRGGGYTTDLKGATSGVGTVFTGADNVWGTGAHGLTGAARESAGVDAHYGIAATWDYFKTEHNRAGIANDGRGTYARVHYGTN